MGEIADLLGSSTAFSGMPRNEAMRIVDVMLMQTYRKGDVLAEEGAPSAGKLILIVSGEVQISSRGATDGGHLVFRKARPGHLIGEVGFIDNQPHSATCMALTDMHVAVMQRDHLVHLLEHNALAAAQLMAGLLRLLAQRIRVANTHMLSQDRKILALQKEQLARHRESVQ